LILQPPAVGGQFQSTYLSTGRGSLHVVYEKSGVEEILTFQDHKGMGKPYHVKQMFAVIKKHRLGERE